VPAAGRLAGKRTLLVGAATGIGRAIAQAFATEGASVVIADLNERDGNATAQLASSVGPRAVFVQVDVRSESSVEGMVGHATDALGGLDALVNVAGVLRVKLIRDMTAEDWTTIFDVNVRGQFFTIKYAAHALGETGHGSIINVASAAGFKAGPGNVAYAASKGAVIAFSRTLAIELAPGIRVNALCPGFVDTPFNQPAYDFIGGRDQAELFVQRAIPLRRMASPSEIAP
jgi:dihydroanticapsin dehydrogenase